MAAAGGIGLGAGGGKIRSRRYHLSSGRAPYSKSRQQNQQGIISRVKDTVKSIVPSWLQKYFNSVDESNEVPQHSNEPEEHVETQNDVENDHFSDKESLPLFGRSAPEPDKIQSDSATNQLMNIPDVLTRPSLHRSNLNFNILDSPALNCQPSTSGFSLVKEIKDSASLHDDDNISTTSGFSSRASDKDVAVTKTGNVPLLWSPEADRTHNVSQNSSFNSKKPAFNPSAFASFASPNSSRLGDSPFYPGKTTYGGAAAACQSRVRSTPYRVPVKKQVVAKPAHVTYGVTSLAARRILQSLEKMSSPLADAKRIPSVSSVSPLATERSFSGESLSKRKKVESSLPPVQKLVTPQSISVSSSLRKIRPSLASTLSNTSSCRTQSFDKHKEKRNQEPDVTQQQTSFSYPISSTPASNGFASSRGGGKMMRERGSTKPPEEEVEAPCLPAIPLPISMTALPKFSLNTEQRTSPLSVRQPVPTKCTVSTDGPGFNFSQPVVKALSSSEEPTASPVGFTFRAPALKSSSPQENTKSMISSPEITSKVKVPIAINSSSTKKAEEEQITFCKPAQSLKEGSVLDILRSPSFQSTSSEPTRTTPPKSAVSNPKPLMFGQSNKQALGIWYCDCCLLENKASDSKCVACQTVKDQATEVTKPSPTLAATTSSKNTSPLKCVQGFGDMFKAAPGTWDCDTCLVQNKPESSKCVACGSPKPGTGAKDPLLVLPTTKADKPVAPPDNGLTLSPSLKFEALARKPIGSWECPVCCVQNKAEDNKCIACTSPKPGTSATLAATSFPTSLPATQGELQGFGKSSFSVESTFPPIKFGLPQSSDTGEQKSSSSTDSSSSNTNKVSFSFTFGQSSKTLDEKKDKDFTFGTTTGSSNAVSAPFKFGFSSPASAEKDSGVKPLTNFQFGTAPSKPESSSNASLIGLPAKEKSDITPSFGLKELEEKKTETPVVGGFTFGKLDQKESASPFVFGKSEEKTESTPTVTSFGSKSDEQPKTFMFGKPEAGKADSSTSGSFAFGVPNTAEKKEADQPAKPVFAFGSSATETGSSKPVFGFQGNGSSSAPQSSSIGSSSSVFGSVPQTSSSNVFGSAVQSNTAAAAGGAPAPSSTVFSSSVSLTVPTGSSNMFGAALSSNTPSGSSSMFGNAPASGTPTSSSVIFGSVATVNTSSSSNVFGSSAPTNTSASSNTLFGNSSASTNPSSVPFVFGQPTTTASGSVFGSGNESKSSFFSGQESKPAETSASTTQAAVSPFVFGASASTPAATGFSFSGTNTSNSTGTSATPFIFGASQSAPAASGLAATSSVPTFGKSVAQTNAPAFGAPASGPLFPSGSQTVPSFGTLTSNVQSPAFGQQSTQPTFGSSTAPPAGSSFQFGNANFNFGGASSTGVFTFGSNPSANPAQPSNSGFGFNQTPSFNLGSNGKTAAPSSISNRKIKTARRRK